MVTKQDLKQLKKIRREKIDLEKRIENNKPKASEIVTDTAKDYRTGYPRIISITGLGDNRWAKLNDRYVRKEIELENKILELEGFLESVPDAEMRMILRMKYEDGMTSHEIGNEMGTTAEAIRKKEERFWQSSHHVTE